MNTHPKWGQVRQSTQHQGQQGHSQVRQPQQLQTRQQKPSDHGGFDSLVVDRKCRFKTGDGEVIEGLVVAASKYFYLVNVDGQVVVINKAWVVSITPVQSPTTNSQENTNNNVGGANERADLGTK